MGMRFASFDSLGHVAALLGWMLIYLLVVRGVFPDLVLCFGDQGHVAVEISHRLCPHLTSQNQKPCLDLPLLQASGDEHLLVMVQSPTRQDLVTELVGVSATLPLFGTVSAPDVLPFFTLPPNAPIPSLRPVILLI
jgi:hypothetical protein